MKRSFDRKYFFYYMSRIIKSGRLPAQASQLAYSFILSFIPLVMMLIAFLGRFAIVQDEIYAVLEFMLPYDAYTLVEGIINEILTSRTLGLVSSIPFIYFISHATRGVIRITDSVYSETTRRGGLRLYIMSVVYAVILLLSLAVLLVMVVFGEIILYHIFEQLSLSNEDAWINITNILRFISAFFILWGFLSVVYAASPNLKLRLRDVYIGSFFSSVAWIFISWIFGIYVNNFSGYGILFGSLGGIFILLVWLYISSYIMLLGVYINRALKGKE